MYDFHSILTAHGFNRKSYDFESTIIGFDYDIHSALLGRMTVFDIDRCRIYRQYDNPHAFVRADLVRKRYCIDRAVKFFEKKWRDELRYINPVCEIIEIYESSTSANIHVLTISEHNAITLTISIT